MEKVKLKDCARKECTEKFKQYNSLVKHCSKKCFYLDTEPKQKKKRKRIKAMSEKQRALHKKYMDKAFIFLNKPENKYCAVFPNKLATQVHHKMGRVGYADEFAEERGIVLIEDIRFFLAVSYDGHEKIEKNPEWAKENGLSLDRLNFKQKKLA